MNDSTCQSEGAGGPAAAASICVKRTSECNSMDEMLAAATQTSGWAGSVRTDDGWRRPLPDGLGFRHDFNSDVAHGGWEFRVLRPGLSLATVDYTVQQPTPRRHRLGDNLVLSAVLSGASQVQFEHGSDGALAHGYCTIYGMHAGDEIQTYYVPSEPLKWVSVFIEPTIFFDFTGIKSEDLWPDLNDFLVGGESLSPYNIPLSNAASMAAHDIFENTFHGSLARALLTAKALELACQILLTQARSLDESMLGPAFTRSDFGRLRRAKELLEQRVDEPVNVAELSHGAGLTRQKLQLGFRLLYGDTVGRVRDKIRMQHALRLVRESDLPMIQIALDTGYEHPASFTRAFRAAFGASPIQVRRVARQAALPGRTRPQAP